MRLGGCGICHGIFVSRLARFPGRPPVRSILTLAIETSCDDTCVAILGKRTRYSNPSYLSPNGPHAKLFFNEKITSNNTGYGGIHPVVSLESHHINLANLISKALQSLPDGDGNSRSIIQTRDGMKCRPDFVTVTRGPGMRSSLSCGLDTAKGLATAWQVPLVAVHHMQAHALTPRLVNALEEVNESNAQPSFPFLTLLVSGGHTLLVHSKSLIDHEIMASTRDIAIGDALDKVGRVLLPEEVLTQLKDTAFAKHLSKFAFAAPDEFKYWKVAKTRAEEIDRPVNEFGWQMKAPLAETRELAFSFSGLASHAERLFMECQGRGTIAKDERLLFARTATAVAFEHLASRTIIALELLKAKKQIVKTLVVSGGVAANDFLRYSLRETLNARGFPDIELLFPPAQLCTDNAAMIAWTGMEMFEAGYSSDLGCLARRKWSLDGASEDGGILGAGGWEKRNLPQSR